VRNAVASCRIRTSILARAASGHTIRVGWRPTEIIPGTAHISRVAGAATQAICIADGRAVDGDFVVLPPGVAVWEDLLPAALCTSVGLDSKMDRNVKVFAANVAVDE